MFFSTERIARACARRPWLTLGAWVVALVVGIGAIGALLDLTSEGEITSNPESEQGYSLIDEHFPPDPNAEWVNELVVVHSARRTVADPGFRRKVQALLADVSASAGVHNAKSVYSSKETRLVSPDRHATLIPVGLQGDCEESADAVMGAVRSASDADFDVAMTGECSADSDLDRILNDDLKTGELYFGIPAALVILVLVFGALVAAVVPLVVAIFAISIALGLAALFSQVLELSVFLFQMTTVMGLAIATDYGLFIVSRYREERVLEREKLDAIAGAGGTASRAVLFSGLAFVFAMCGLLLVPDSVLRSLGVGALTVGLVSVIAALTLVPALLGLLGDKVNALRVPLLGRVVESAGREGRIWSAIARAVMRRPVVSLAAATVLLLVVAAPVRDLRLSRSGDSILSGECALAPGLCRARARVRRRHRRLGTDRRRGRRDEIAVARRGASPRPRYSPQRRLSGPRALGEPRQEACARERARRRRQPGPPSLERRSRPAEPRGPRPFSPVPARPCA